jgi:hypothetical protein
MYLSPDEARSDVILTGAAVVFGGVLLELLLTAPVIPRSGIGLEVVVLLSLFAVTGLVPLLLARYRDDVPGGFGLVAGRPTPVGPALLLAAPVVVLGIVRGLLIDGSLSTAALGWPGIALFSSPVVGDGEVAVSAGVLMTLRVLVITVGTFLLLGFLVVRGREAFRHDDRSSTELLRTIGAGTLAVALVLGGLGTIGGGSFVTVLLNVLALAAVLLVADRLVPHHARITRPAVLTPMVLVVVAHVFAAGGLFRGGLLTGLAGGAFAAGIVLAAAVVAEERGSTAVAAPLLLATYWWPTMLGPLPFVP